MKEVLKHGKAWHEQHILVVCPNCQCEFLCELPSDVEQDYAEDIMSEWDYVSKPYVRCPECGERIENYKKSNDYINKN